MMFEELNLEERKLLLTAFEYKIDEDNHIIDYDGSKIKSEENPNTYLKVENVALIPGSLKIKDGSPTSISKIIREKNVGNRSNSC